MATTKTTTSKTAQTAKAAGAKTPEDHKDPKRLEFDQMEGHDLLKPFDKVKGSDQLRLLAQIKNMGLMGKDGSTEEDGPDMDDLDFLQVADLIDYVSEKFAIDPAKFEEFTTGPRGFEKAMNLAIGYAGELGK